MKTRECIQELQKSRSECIRDKNIVYPSSTQDKIVFITNKYGNGFRRENIEDYGVASHIRMERMLADINGVCYREWKNNHERLHK